MSFPQIQTVALTTDASGDATGYTEVIRGRIESVEYVKTDFADGVDFTITLEDTGVNVWTQTNVNAAVVVAPRQATHSTAGVAATYDGTRAVLERIPVAHERVEIVIAQGGNVKSGTFKVVYS
ncbi:MAG TPA: hypothetical protein ENI79_02280 [Rhodospirillales bacterium]|nr:hypothetical protein [Rhodospirillales bacterium]